MRASIDGVVGQIIHPPLISWGLMLQDAATYSVIGTYPWILSPVGFVLVTVFAFNALGDGLRGAVDPIEVAEMTVALAKSLAPTVRYDEMLTRLGYFVTESSEHFAE
jgi:uncharacterized membrane protein